MKFAFLLLGICVQFTMHLSTIFLGALRVVYALFFLILEMK